jgi:hypothetical protein
MVRTIMAATSRDEWQRKASGFEVAKSAAIAAGRWTARKVPLGYLKNEEGRLEPDPATAPLVRELFERRAHGESWWKLSRGLGDALGVGVMNPQRLQYMIASRTSLRRAGRAST